MSTIDRILKITDEILAQVRIWDRIIMRMKMCNSKIITCHKIVMNLVSCRDHNHPRICAGIVENEQELFSLFYISQQLQECDFDTYFKIIESKIPNVDTTHVRRLVKKLSPLMKLNFSSDTSKHSSAGIIMNDRKPVEENE